MGRIKQTRAESEALAKSVIQFYQNEAGKSSKLTWLHFKAKGIPKATVYNYIKSFGDSGEVKFNKNPGRPSKLANPEVLERMQSFLTKNPSATLGAVAKEFNISKSWAKQVIEEKLGIGSSKYQAALRNESEPLGGHYDTGNPFQGESYSGVRPTSSPVTEDINGGCDWDDDDYDNICEGTEFTGDGDKNHTDARCFICDASNASRNLELSFPPSAIPPVHNEVDKSVGVIWFLKTVLEMRSKDLSNLLEETTGMNPCEWGISVCSDPECKGAMDKVFHVWSELKRLEVELKKRREKILGRVRRCLISRGIEGYDFMLNDRVREVVLGVKNTMTKMVSAELPGNANDLIVKMEVDDEEFNDFDDFLHSGDSGNVSEEQHQHLVKSEFSEEVFRRRSSRARRGTDKFKCSVLSVSKNRSALEKRTKNLNLKNVKGKKSGKKAIASVSDKVYSCQSCPLLEKMDMYMFIAHLAFHSRNAYKCTECNNHFKSNENGIVQKHWEEHHPQLLKSDSPRVIHVTPAEAAGKVYPCLKPNCKLQFGSADDRNEHNRKNSGWSPKLSCSICSSPPQFRNRMELRLHKAIDHPEDGMFSCCYCDATFEIQSEKDDIKLLHLDQLRKHICEAHGQSSYVSTDGKRKARFLQTCPICGLVFCSIDYSKLDRHLVEEHGRKLYETYTCPICSKQMRYSDSWRHTRVNHWLDAPKLPRSYICQFCGKGFRSIGMQKNHEDIHRNQESKPYQCELCGASFSVTTYLYMHLRVTHEGHVFPSVLRKKAAAQKKSRPSSTGNTCETTEDA